MVLILNFSLGLAPGSSVHDNAKKDQLEDHIIYYSQSLVIISLNLFHNHHE